MAFITRGLLVLQGSAVGQLEFRWNWKPDESRTYSAFGMRTVFRTDLAWVHTYKALKRYPYIAVCWLYCSNCFCWYFHLKFYILYQYVYRVQLQIKAYGCKLSVVVPSCHSPHSLVILHHKMWWMENTEIYNCTCRSAAMDGSALSSRLTWCGYWLGHCKEQRVQTGCCVSVLCV